MASNNEHGWKDGFGDIVRARSAATDQMTYHTPPIRTSHPLINHLSIAQYQTSHPRPCAQRFGIEIVPLIIKRLYNVSRSIMSANPNALKSNIRSTIHQCERMSPAAVRHITPRTRQ